jgi:type IV pilus assembly protein PilC
MQFSYQARDSFGRVQSGEIVADSEEAASQQLRQDGFYILSIQGKSAAANSTSTLFQRRVKRTDVIYMTNQLAVMIDAGVPLTNAIEGLARQTENPTLQAILRKIQDSVQAGEDFSSALSRHPKQFDKTYVNLIRASEASGTMSEMLDRIASQSRNELETRQKVKGALMYPFVMLLMCLGVCTFLLVYVFPKLTPMFEGRDIEVPGPTLFLMAISDFLINQWIWVIIGVVVIVATMIYARGQTWGRIAYDWVWINIPLFGVLCRKAAIGRSLRTLATTINAGVPMLESLELCAGVSNNYFFEKCWMAVSEKVTTGKQIHEALEMEANSLIPPTVLQMIASGESTGKLGKVLDKVSDYFEAEVSNTVKATTSLIEPLMIATMGCAIGTIALAMLLPIFKLSTSH